jgi:biopolymer transport protein ExbD
MRGITPLIDLLFILLFGLLALSDARRTESAEMVRIQLPEVEPTEKRGAASANVIVLEIDAESDVRIEGREEPIEDPEELDTILADRIGDTLPEEFAIEIRGDADARHGVMVALLQHLRERGFGSVNLLALGDPNASWSEEGR